MDDAIGAAESTRMQRFLRGAVAVLLTANGFALALVATDDAAGPLPTLQGTRTVTLIQQPDGTTTQVDPSTPEGRAAIEQAKRSGATITRTTVATPPTTAAGQTETTVLDDKDGGWSQQSPLPLPVELPDAGETVDGAQDLLNGTIDKAQDTLKNTIGTTPVDDTVDEVQDTVDKVVDDVQTTVTTLLGPVLGTTTTTTKPATTTTTAKPNLVQDPVGTVTGTVGGVTGGLGL